MSDLTGGSASSAAAAAKRAARAEAQRRRRQNPEVRAAEAEAYRRRRREDPAVRAAETEAHRRRRENPAVRAAEAEARRRRLEDPAAAAKRAARAEAQRRRRQNPEVRAAEAEAKRRRRDDPAVRAAEAELQRRRRREDPAVRAAEAEAKRRRREDLAVRAAEAEVQRRRRRHREDPAVRAARAEARRRRLEDRAVRAAEAEASDRRRQEDTGVSAAEAEAKRHRRVPPAVRAAEAEAYHRRRQEDTGVSAAEAESSDHRRQEDTGVSAAEPEVSDRRSENPAVRAAGAEAYHRHRQDTGVSAAEAEASDHRRQEDTNVSAAEAEPKLHRPENPAVRAAEAEASDRRRQEDTGQRDGTRVGCSTSPAAFRLPYYGPCIVRWCTNTSPERLFRVPKDNRMEAFLKYAERPQLFGLPKEVVHFYRVCSAHFTESDYKDPAKTKLKWLAVPSVKAPDESKAPDACEMPRLTNMDQSPGVATLHSLQEDGQCDGSFLDCSTSPDAFRKLYDGSCIVRWCTNTSPRRLFRVPKDNRMEAFLRYAERPQLIGLPKDTIHRYRVCSAHFTESDYMDPAKTKLKWLAVPSVKAADESEALHMCGMPRLTNVDQSPGVATLYSHQEDKDRKKEPASCCTHGKSTKPVQTETSWLFSSSVDVAVETSRTIDVCKSTQTTPVAVKVHRWTETTDLVESKDSDTHLHEFPAPHACKMPRLTNMDQGLGVATLYSHQVDRQCESTCVGYSTSPAAFRTLYNGTCIVRWCTNTSPGRLFRVPKDNRMEAFLKYAEMPQLIGLPKDTVHHYRVCSAHFTESDYMDPAKTKLKWSAVPSVKDPDESKAPHVGEMPRVTNMDQSPGVATLYSHQVDEQHDGTSVDCSNKPSAVRLPYYGSCIVRWCTNASPGRLFRVPKDNRMEAFLKYAERPQLFGLPKEVVHYYRICSAHFIESDYMDPAKTKLKWLAVPSVKAPDESKGDAASPGHQQELPPQPGPSGL
ncbi:uncharacterized protein LOC142564170 [Dermacentor variabilis]|uniref:uncharacterized protein LOC142564170 n=1 Tax=Dermacentor variabilis TaxID=34621 RepID=UPI003F5C6850